MENVVFVDFVGQPMNHKTETVKIDYWLPTDVRIAPIKAQDLGFQLSFATKTIHPSGAWDAQLPTFVWIRRKKWKSHPFDTGYTQGEKD